MIDKRLLDSVLTVELLDRTRTDAYGKTPYTAPKVLKYCRLDRSRGENGTNNNKTVSNTSTAFIYPQHTPVTINDDWKGAKVTDEDGNVYTVGHWLVNKLNGRVFSYELELK